MLAAKIVNTDVVNILLENGVDFNDKDNNGSIIIVIILHYFYNFHFIHQNICISYYTYVFILLK